MSIGKRKNQQQDVLWLDYTQIPQAPGNPFYEAVNTILDKYKFDNYVEDKCAPYYATKRGRPSIPPGIYFRMIMIGYFEGIGSERGIAWRCADSLSLKEFLGYSINEKTPDHSSLTKIRQRFDIEIISDIFQFILKILATEKLINGQTIGYDATTLEANAALRSLVRRDTGDSYNEYLESLAKSSGIDTPTRDDCIKTDKSRKNKTLSNKDWEHPHDPDARVAKMKNGATHMAHKVEHAVDLDSGAIISVTLHGADKGDTTTIIQTLDATCENLQSLCDDTGTREEINDELMLDAVCDKGYHSNAILETMDKKEIRSYVSEPSRGRRKWTGKRGKQNKKNVYSNRRRIQGNRGKKLMRRRSEKVERSFAHCYGSGGMRRCHLREHENILKRLLLHTTAFNLSLVLRKIIGSGTPRGLHDRVKLFIRMCHIENMLATVCRTCKISARRKISREIIDISMMRLSFSKKG